MTGRLHDAAAFFVYVRKREPLGPTLTTEEVTGCETVLKACEGWPPSWAAYALATAYHETAGTLRPIREYGKGKGRTYGKPDKTGQVAYGRGYVQLTWPENYAEADKRLKLDGALVADYDLALRPDIAAKILRHGMEEGWFTARSLQIYLPPVAKFEDFKKARRIINGTDRDALIAEYAVTFQEALVKAGWR